LNKIKQLAGQTAIYGFSSMGARFINYLLVPFQTNILITSTYGIVSEMYAYVPFLIIILTYGMETGFFRFAESKYDYNKVFGTTFISLFISSVLFAIFIVIFAQPIADLLNYHNNKDFILWLGFVISIDALTSIPFAKLRQQNKAKRFAAIKLIGILINVLFNIFFLWLCPKVINNNPDSFLTHIYSNGNNVAYVFISNFIASLITLLLLLPDIFNFRLYFDKVIFKKMLIYSLPLLVAGLAGMTNETMDRIFIKHFLPGTTQEVMEQIGIYSANYKIAILMTLFIQMFRYAADPFFFAQQNDKDSKQIYADVMKYFVIFCLVIFLGVMMYIDIIKYFIGEDFRSGLRIVPIVLLANLFLGVFFNLSIWYKLNNKTKLGAYLAIFGAIITVVLNIWLIPLKGYFGGIMGGAWATFFCYFSMMVVSYFLGNHYFPVKYNLRRIFGYFFLALLLYFISIFTKTNIIVANLIVNTFLFLIFVTLIIYKEKFYKYLLIR
jgi:O-antigen/teichoic acid export membrane protein